MYQLKRAIVKNGGAESWVSGYHLVVRIQSPVGSTTSGPSWVLRVLNKTVPITNSIHSGWGRLEMELEQLLDYHRGTAIWWPEGEVAFIDGSRRCQLQDLLTRNLQGEACVKETFMEIGELLGIFLPTLEADEKLNKENAVVCHGST
ncbi:MAG: hypothetical protein NVSMB27_47030 [Ktedonobacteraceae bacterium]